MQVVQSIKIARPPDSVGEIIADPTRDPQWCRKVKSVRPAGLGRWTCRLSSGICVACSRRVLE